MGSNKMEFYKNGMGKFNQGDFDGAIAEFKKALEVDPNFGDVHQSLAHIYERQGNLDAALEAAKKAVECNPDDPLAHTSLSMFYQRKGMIPEAEKEQALAAQLSAKNP